MSSTNTTNGIVSEGFPGISSFRLDLLSYFCERQVVYQVARNRPSYNNLLGINVVRSGVNTLQMLIDSLPARIRPVVHHYGYDCSHEM